MCLIHWLNDRMGGRFDRQPTARDLDRAMPTEKQVWDFLASMDCVRQYWRYKAVHQTLTAGIECDEEPPTRAAPSTQPKRAPDRPGVPSDFAQLDKWEHSIRRQWCFRAPFQPPKTLHPKLRIVVHLFSGHRREGDYQWWMEGLLGPKHPDVIYISVDTAISSRYNILQGGLWDFLMEAAALGCIIALVSGPPCESWSGARELVLIGDDGMPKKGPRPIRDKCSPWGKAGCTVRELQQIHVGTVLLLRALLLAVRAAHHGARCIIEHPGEPREENTASIWRISLMALLTGSNGLFDTTDVQQFQFGSQTVKPTRLLYANLPLAALMELFARRDLLKPSKVLAGRAPGRLFQNVHRKAISQVVQHGAGHGMCT